MRTAVLVLLFCVFPSIVVPAESEGLTPEGKARKAAHDFLFDSFVKGRETKFSGEGADRILNEVVISRERHEVTGEVTIALPKGTERVAGMFRYLVLRGERLDQLEGIRMLPYAPDSDLAISTRQPEIYRVKVAAMPVPSDDMPEIVLKTSVRPGSSAVITEIALNSQGKLSVRFDDIPYRNLGADRPRVVVPLVIDTQAELSIDGHVDLEREKFCRYYAAPGNLPPSFEHWAAERGFAPGRQIFKLQPALVVGYSRRQPLLKEDPARKGAADLSFFDRYDSSAPATIPEFRNVPYAMCLNDYPEFMCVPLVGRGTPLPEHFDDAAELAAAYIADQIRDGGRTATWWEVKNESTIKAEWDYHWRKDVDSWQLLADFHNRVADAVHGRAEGVKVGGPTSAWMQLHAAGFGLYRNQARFMDLTKEHLDFYSHHFYEDIGTLGAWERRGGRYTNYLLGRLEATLDMLVAHMSATDNVKPILITECGSLQPGRGPGDYWLRLRSYSAYLNKFMQRPQQIDLVVPFAFLSIPWNPRSGDAAFIPRPGRPANSPLSDCDPTPVTYLFELWRDFDGRRLPVAHQRDWLDVTAVYRDNVIQLAVTNMSGDRLALNIADVVGPLPVQDVTQKRLYYLDGKIRFEPRVRHRDAASIPVDVEETTIVTIRLARPVVPKETVNAQHWYAPQTAVHGAGDTQEFVIETAQAHHVASAELVIGLQRDGGISEAVTGAFQGHSFSVQPKWLKEFRHLFAPVRVTVPSDLVGNRNTVRVTVPEGAVITSVHLKTQRRQPAASRN